MKKYFIITLTALAVLSVSLSSCAFLTYKANPDFVEVITKHMGDEPTPPTEVTSIGTDTEIAPETEKEPIDLSDMTEEEMKEALLPYLEAYNLWLLETFGVEADFDNPHFRYYNSEEEAYDKSLSELSDFTAIVKGNEEAPEGLTLDPALASCYPISNFSSLAELEGYVGQYIDLENEDFSRRLKSNLFEHDGVLYLLRGGRGYGTLEIDVSSARFASDEDKYQIEVDEYLFDEKESEPAVLTFGIKNGRLLITSTSKNH